VTIHGHEEAGGQIRGQTTRRPLQTLRNRLHRRLRNPEDSWFIFPLPHILGLTSLLLSPKNRRKPHPNNPYREAWHLLRQPDSLEFA